MELQFLVIIIYLTMLSQDIIMEQDFSYMEISIHLIIVIPIEIVMEVLLL